MPPVEAADPWGEVWDAYEARQATPRTAPAPLPSERAPRAAPRRRRRRVVLAMGLALGLVGFSGPARPLLGMAGLALWPEVPVLLAGLHLPPGLAPPPLPAPEAATPEAGRYLATLSGAVAEGWRDPPALRRMLLAHQALPPRRDAALRPLEVVRRLRPLGWGRVRLEIGPAEGPGGLGLDLAWQPEGWRVMCLQPLDPEPPGGQT